MLLGTRERLHDIFVSGQVNGGLLTLMTCSPCSLDRATVVSTPWEYLMAMEPTANPLEQKAVAEEVPTSDCEGRVR